MLTSAQIRNARLKPVRFYFSDDRFREGFFRVVAPVGDQKEKLDEILNRYAKLNGEFQANLRKELDVNFREMKKELESVLSKEQVAKLREMDEKRQKMMKEFRRNRPDSSDFNRFDHRNDRGFRNRNPGEMPYIPGERPHPPRTDSVVAN
jgi:hypothetical protein